MFLEFAMRAQDRACVLRVKVILACSQRGFPWLYFFKNRSICLLKVIFSILTFLKLI